MQAEAEANAETDKKRKDLIEARNHLDGLVYTAEKTIKDAGDKATDEDKKTAQDAIDEAKKALADEASTPEIFEKVAMDLSEKIQKVGAAMYADAPGGDAAPEEVEATENDGKTEPTEGEVVDDTKAEGKPEGEK